MALTCLLPCLPLLMLQRITDYDPTASEVAGLFYDRRGMTKPWGAGPCGADPAGGGGAARLAGPRPAALPAAPALRAKQRA